MKPPALKDTNQVLPPVYARWTDEVLGGPIPPELEATCDDCAMCGSGEELPKASVYFFEPSIKCCSYVPELPNYVVGGILVDDDPAMDEGRRTLEARLAEGVAITPLGLGRHPTFQILYNHFTASQAFGRSRSIRCPHYLEATGRCSIWRHREAVCTTWFCKHNRGAVGSRFWVALHQLLASIELELQRWCVVTLDLGAPALRRLFALSLTADQRDPIKAGDLDGVPDPAVHQANWGNWAGREREFYAESARLVGELSWDQVLQIGGIGLEITGRLMRDAYAALMDETVPERVRAGTFELRRAGTDYSRVATYSPNDPVDVPKAALDVLHYFDGRPTRQVLETITMERGIEIDLSLVRRLVDFGVLVPVDHPTGGTGTQEG
jgi:Fe-S-cluster containining protein